MKVKLHKAAVVLEQARLDAVQHAREAEELAAELAAHEPAPAPEPDPEPAQDIASYYESAPVEVQPEVKKPWLKRLFDWL